MKVLVVTGSSGGHIFPAVSFLETLKYKYKEADTLLVLPKRSNIKGEILPSTYKIKYISIVPVGLSINFNNLTAILKFLKGSLESLFILIEFKPDVVVGFGSISCVPLLIFAWAFRINTLIHEQNVLPGRANRLLVKFSDRTAISFADTKDYLKVNPRKIVLTGNPIRPGLRVIEKKRALDFFNFTADKITILVTGGSLGSHNINTAFLRSILTMANHFRFQIIHLSGVKDYSLLERGYRDSGLSFRLFSFLMDMDYVYSASDFVICRGGATTIAELVYFSLPAIIVPYPFAYKHQFNNAQVLERMGTAIVVRDDDLDGSVLKESLISLVDNPNRLKFMRAHYAQIHKPNANELLADSVISLVGR